MTEESHLATLLLKRSGISLLDAARLVQQMLDLKPKDTMNAIAFCTKVIQVGLSHMHIKVMSVADGFNLYLTTKDHLRPDSLRDIRYLGRRLLSTCPELAQRNFSAISLSDCERWLDLTFSTPSQFNKGRAMLHALFAFAMKREWCERNVVKLVDKRKIVEQEIQALSLDDTQRIQRECKKPSYADCTAGVSLLIWAGLRPTELRRLSWGDVDLAESVITIRSQCSKTGGTRQVDICHALAARLKERMKGPTELICPPDWTAKWRQIRENAGFKGRWVQDVLRHTYASYHAKYYKDLALLQYNMGHRDQSLLRSRYINMRGITRQAAKRYFKIVS